ncbi:glycosyltransferase family 2 protein [Aggregatilineales bacterium SYSU G02658]
MTQLGVLITYYNERDLLTECLESLLANTQLPDEILVYDDCSEFPAADYVPDHPLIRVVRGARNHGVIYARNMLLEASSCDYLHFHDADDLFMPTWVERVCAALASAPDLVITLGDYRYEDGAQELLRHMHDHFDLLEQDFKAFSVLVNLNTICLTFKRELARRIGGVNVDGIAGSWDYYFGAKLAHAAQSVVMVQESLFVVQERRGSLSIGEDRDMRPRIVLGMVQALKLLAPKYPHLADAVAQRIAELSGRLYTIGMKPDAAAGFAAALKLGRPTYEHFGQPWRTIARTLGPMTAHRLFDLYAHPSLVKLRAGLKRLAKR